MTNVLLAFHLLGVACFLVGGVVVGVLQLGAIRRERPSEVQARLRRAPFGVALVGTGALLTLGFGIALAEHEALGLSPAWIQASLGLWVAAMVLGAYGGRTARHARHLAARLAAEGDAPSPELHALVSKRGPLYASYASFLLLAAIVVLMVWQPGGSAEAVVYPKTVPRQILHSYRQLDYLPTRLPSGVTYARYGGGQYPNNKGFYVVLKGADGEDALRYSVYPIAAVAQDACDFRPLHKADARHDSMLGTLTVNGYEVGWEDDRHGASAWRCETHHNVTVYLQAEAMKAGVDVADLATVVAYAAPFG